MLTILQHCDSALPARWVRRSPCRTQTHILGLPTTRSGGRVRIAGAPNSLWWRDCGRRTEASGSYSWLVDEMERSGHRPKLANPLEAKRRMGLTNKTDKLDAKALAILLRNGTLPEVWIPPSELRDQRELLRLRIFLVRLRTRVKNRIHGTLSRHDVQVPGADLCGAGPRESILNHTAKSIEIEEIDARLKDLEAAAEMNNGGARR